MVYLEPGLLLLLQTSSVGLQPGIEFRDNPGSARSYSFELCITFRIHPSNGLPAGVWLHLYWAGSNCSTAIPPIWSGVFTFRYSLNGGISPVT